MQSLHRRLMLTSAVMMSTICAYGRRAYGACINVGGSNFECSGASTAQSINAANAAVTTLPGFSVMTGSSNALSITGTGDLSYTDTNASPLDATAGNGLNVFSSAVGAGSITIDTNGPITARNYGIRGRNLGTGALSITVDGDVTSNGTSSLSRGIVAFNFGSNLALVTGAGADISGARYGILARNYGTGSTSVTVNGDVTATGTTGTDTALLARGNAAVTVTTAAGTTVTGQENGIFARSDGSTGVTTVTVNGDVTGTNDDGIYARGGASGSISITVASTGSVTSNGAAAGDFAIDTSEFGVSATSLTVAGAIDGGAGGAVRLQSANDRLELQPGAVVSGTVFAGAGNDTFVLGGTGIGSFDVSLIGAGQQYRDFEIFQKEDASQWTLTGTNTTLSNFAVNGGTLIVSGSLPNTPFTVNSATLELTGSGSVGSVDIASAAGIFDISGTTSGASITTLSGVAGSSVLLGAETLTLTNASGTFAGAISGNGGLVLDSGTEILSGISGFTGSTIVNGGTLQVDGSIASSSGLTVQSGGVITGTGTVPATSVASGGTLRPGNITGTLNVDGNLTLNPGSLLDVQLNNPPPGTMVTAVNGIVTLSGALLNLRVGSQIAPAATYIIIDNDGVDPVVGTFASVTENLPFLTPFVVYNAGTGNDVAVRMLRNDIDWCFIAHTINQCDVIRAFRQFPLDNELLSYVVVQDAAGARQAADALSGEIHATLSGVLMDDSRYVRDAIYARLLQAASTRGPSGQLAVAGSAPIVVAGGRDPLLPGRMALGAAEQVPSHGPRYRGPLAFWTDGYGAWGDFDGNGNAASADRSLGGFVSGMDADVGGGWRGGLATGYAQSNLGVDARLSSARVESYHLGGYAGGRIGAMALRGGGVWTWSRIDTGRDVVFPGFFEYEAASYGADTGQVFAEAALPLFASTTAFEPFARLAYVHVATDGFTEGGSLAALSSSGGAADVGYSALGARAAGVLQARGLHITPYASIAWQRAFGDLSPVAALVFASAGIGFEVFGVPIVRDSALIEAGMTVALAGDAAIGLAYSGQIADDLSDNAITGRMDWRF
jgi:autotransporter-associated beta strand protein